MVNGDNGVTTVAAAKPVGMDLLREETTYVIIQSRHVVADNVMVLRTKLRIATYLISVLVSFSIVNFDRIYKYLCHCYDS